MAGNNLKAAREKFDQSLQILADSNERDYLPYVQMSLADLDVEEHRGDEARKLLDSAIVNFRSQQSQSGEIWALGLLARAELESGNATAAWEKISEAEHLAGPHGSSKLDFDTRLARARLEGATGGIEAAKTELRTIATIAEAQGNIPNLFEVRLALGEIAVRSHDASRRKILDDLAADAEAKGYVLMAEKARLLLSQ